MKDSLENQAIQLLLLDAPSNKMTWMRDRVSLLSENHAEVLKDYEK